MLAAIIPVFTNGSRAMSESGDVVWSDGKSWQRDASPIRKDTKAWWYNPKAHTEALGWTTMANLRRSDDFAWLVKDGIPIVLNALAVYHALDSFADFVAKRGADAALTAERDELLSRLADVRAELEPWGLERLARGNRTLAEQVHDIRQSWTALRDANRHNVSRADAVEQQLATAHAEHEKSLTDWARAREERDQARRELADLQRLVAAAEANEPVLVHPDWRQAEIDALAEERDQLKEKVRMLTLVSRHETLVAEAYRLENNIKEASKERDELNEKLATEMGIREQIQRNCDYADKQNLELRRQFDVVIDDRNILRARCDELERGDRHSCGVKCGRQEERRAVVAWLNKDPQGWARQWSLAGRIERGEHDV